MNGIETLKEYPKSAIVVKQWFLEKMLDSLNNESLPEDFKEIVRKQGIDDERVAAFIDLSPRALFDVFDNHKIYIETIVKNGNFLWKIDEELSTIEYDLRKNCEASAILKAFELLNNKL
jgi:hypothetical protein